MQSACDTPSFAANTYLLVRASLKPDARRWLLSVSRGQECSGPFEEPTPSWLSAAALSMAILKTTGSNAGRLNFHFYVAHPSLASSTAGRSAGPDDPGSSALVPPHLVPAVRWLRSSPGA